MRRFAIILNNRPACCLLAYTLQGAIVRGILLFGRGVKAAYI